MSESIPHVITQNDDDIDKFNMMNHQFLTYETYLDSGNTLTAILQFVRRGEFMQRVSNNPNIHLNVIF